MVPHQHTTHVDSPNQAHLKRNILELIHSDGFFFPLFLHFYLLQVDNFNISWFPKAEAEGKWEITLPWSSLHNRFCGTFLIIKD